MALVGEFLFVRYKVVDSGMAIFTDHETPLSHFRFAEAVYIPFLGVNRPGDEMMLGELLPTTTYLAARDRLTSLGIFPRQP